MTWIPGPYSDKNPPPQCPDCKGRWWHKFWCKAKRG